ncbi:sodium/potassium-transporting ATPase subunit beta-like [Tigriopus californicus]|uniref:sodium/potassium-transporting ATPase subunit beta-like n=1 Tax=Tigriopus californicus TaxID=6832 RepID=UPI0027DA80A6|nr:sodium/potassium-transporting ATPase subunit beta-like [Tigriopus californicus]
MKKDTSFEETNGTSSITDEKANLAEPKVSPSNMGRYIYNSKTNEMFGRTFSSWIRLVAFSLVFIVVLTVFWAICLWAFSQTMDNYTPRLQTSMSYIGQNPGLGYRPMKNDEDPYSSLIWFRHGGAGNWGDLKANLDYFLSKYEPGSFANAGASQTKCHWDRSPLERQEACEFNKEWLSDQGSDIKCISEENYGYYHGKPCILLKLNKIFGWFPDPYYNVTEVENHPDIPDSLKNHIRSTWEENCRNKGPEKEERCPQLNMVWLDCNGEEDPDKENIGVVSYTPWRGFPGYFFPYWNQLGYLQPVVMVQLKNPTPGVLINIECKAWAKGLEHDRTRRRGLVHFEFLMD